MRASRRGSEVVAVASRRGVLVPGAPAPAKVGHGVRFAPFSAQTLFITTWSTSPKYQSQTTRSRLSRKRNVQGAR